MVAANLLLRLGVGVLLLWGRWSTCCSTRGSWVKCLVLVGRWQ